MLFKSAALVVAAASSLAVAQRPANTSICDYYAGALFTTNNATTQYNLLTAIVNRAVIGNTSATTANIAVPGILNPNGTYNGAAVNLVPYFSGGLASTNRGGSSGVSVNFLDGGGAAPLAAGKPANDTSSNQYTLLTHLYEYFGALLGCTQYGMTGFPAYAGAASQYEVHKFMVLDAAQMGYFITQVGLSAASFGAAAADVTAAGQALAAAFNFKCSPKATIIPSQGSQYQSICTGTGCALAPNSSCTDQATIAAPNVSSASTTPTSSGIAPQGTAQPVATATTRSAATRDAVLSAAGLLAAMGVGAFALL